MFKVPKCIVGIEDDPTALLWSGRELIWVTAGDNREHGKAVELREPLCHPRVQYAVLNVRGRPYPILISELLVGSVKIESGIR